jgi:hypothetical protein
LLDYLQPACDFVKIRMIETLACAVLCVAGCNATYQASDLSESGVVERSSETDSLVKLMRRSLTDPDPHDTAQAMMCEIGRLFRVLGEKEAVRQIAEAESKIYTPRNLPAIVRRDSLLHGHTFGVEDCQTDRAVGVQPE